MCFNVLVPKPENAVEIEPEIQQLTWANGGILKTQVIGLNYLASYQQHEYIVPGYVLRTDTCDPAIESADNYSKDPRVLVSARLQMLDEVYNNPARLWDEESLINSDQFQISEAGIWLPPYQGHGHSTNVNSFFVVRFDRKLDDAFLSLIAEIVCAETACMIAGGSGDNLFGQKSEHREENFKETIMNAFSKGSLLHALIAMANSRASASYGLISMNTNSLEEGIQIFTTLQKTTGVLNIIGLILSEFENPREELSSSSYAFAVS